MSFSSEVKEEVKENVKPNETVWTVTKITA